MKLIDAEPIIKFITNGLNDTENPMGHDAIKILTEIAYAPIFSVVDGTAIKVGHWVYKKEQEGYSHIECSVCGKLEKVLFMEDAQKYPYCHCGARMEKVEGNR